MNGRVVLDSNIIMDLFNGNLPKADFIRVLSGTVQIVSVMTCIELLSFPEITGELEEQYNLFLSRRLVIPLTKDVERQTILIRRSNTSVKIPDAMIAATALVMDAALITRDNPLRKALASAVPLLQTISM
jgi:predicted nucleic acid-binding protein